MDAPALSKPPCPHPPERMLFREINTFSGGHGLTIVCPCGHEFSALDGQHVDRMEQVWRNMKAQAARVAA